MVETGKVVQMIIVLEEGDRPIGSVYLRDIDEEHKKAEYGIFIGEPDCYQKGYGTEAAQLMCEYAFSYLGLHKVMLRVYADNERAIKSYEKAGFVKEAYLKDDVFVPIKEVSMDDTDLKNALLEIHGIKITSTKSRVYPLGEAAAE